MTIGSVILLFYLPTIRAFCRLDETNFATATAFNFRSYDIIQRTGASTLSGDLFSFSFCTCVSVAMETRTTRRMLSAFCYSSYSLLSSSFCFKLSILLSHNDSIYINKTEISSILIFKINIF